MGSMSPGGNFAAFNCLSISSPICVKSSLGHHPVAEALSSSRVCTSCVRSCAEADAVCSFTFAVCEPARARRTLHTSDAFHIHPTKDLPPIIREKMTVVDHRDNLAHAGAGVILAPTTPRASWTRRSKKDMRAGSSLGFFISSPKGGWGKRLSEGIEDGGLVESFLLGKQGSGRDLVFSGVRQG